MGCTSLDRSSTIHRLNFNFHPIKNVSFIKKIILIFDKEFRDTNIPIWIISIIIFMNGFLNLYFSLFYKLPYSQTLITNIFSFNVDYLNKTVVFISGLVLIYLSFQILNNKVIAWYLSVSILGLGVITNIIRIQSWYTIILPIIGIILLFVTRKRFIAKIEINTIENNILISILVIILVLVYGTLGFIVLSPAHFQNQYLLFGSFFATIKSIFFLEGNSVIPTTVFGSWFLFSLHLIGIISLILIFHALFRPIYYSFKLLPQEISLAKTILESNGNSSLDYFKLWSDKSLFFSSNKKSFISYRVKYSAAICLGDPSGPKEECEQIIQEFTKFCKINGWKVGFHHVSKEYLEIYKKNGFDYFKIGDEGTVQIEKFVTSTVKHSEFKRTLNKFTKDGFRIEIVKPPHSQELLINLKNISDEWLSTGRRERNFTLGSFITSYLQECQIILLKNKNDEIIAFLNRITSYINGEIIIDMMRHIKEIPNGTMDFIFASYLMLLSKEGFKTFSLGLSPFTGINESPDSPLIEKVMIELFEHFNNLFSFKGLRHFKDKYEPVWEDRYFVFKGTYLSFLKIALAFIQITE